VSLLSFVQDGDALGRILKGLEIRSTEAVTNAEAHQLALLMNVPNIVGKT